MLEYLKTRERELFAQIGNLQRTLDRTLGAHAEVRAHIAVSELPPPIPVPDPSAMELAEIKVETPQEPAVNG